MSNSQEQPPEPFVPALLVIDCQNDFVTGSLAVTSASDIFPTINRLLSVSKFVTRVGTKDWHPADHISFASNHQSPNNKPFKSTTTIINPHNSSETYETRLWPDHCIQNTYGAELVSTELLDHSNLDEIVEKGTDKRVEMYSAFRDPFRDPVVSDSGLAGVLKEKGITHVYVVGLAFDYCVKWTAIDAKVEGFAVYIIKEAVRSVDPGKDEETTGEIEKGGVKVVDLESNEVGWVLRG